jgi:hypothetical protein
VFSIIAASSNCAWIEGEALQKTPPRRVARLLEGMAAMSEIADGVGRMVCQVVWALVPQCQTGQSVANIGYGALALILLSLAVSRFLSRAGG